MLQMMYEKPERWAYTFQSYACISRVRAQIRSANGKLREAENPVQFFERSIYSDRYLAILEFNKEDSVFFYVKNYFTIACNLSPDQPEAMLAVL